MRQSYNFVIESERSVHTLFFNGDEIARLATVGAAEALANRVANDVVPGAALRFKLDFKWMFTDLEIRTAKLEWEANSRFDHRHRPAIGRDPLCG
jgi:hypothetical protein